MHWGRKGVSILVLLDSCAKTARYRGLNLVAIWVSILVLLDSCAKTKVFNIVGH